MQSKSNFYTTKVIKRLLFLFSVLFVASCSTIPTSSVSPAQVKEHWQFNGKFAIKTPDETQAAKINWQQINQQYDINLYTTFGITVMKIKGNDNYVEITTDGAPVVGQSAEQLIWQMTRWHIPVNALTFWVKGQVPDGHDLVYDTLGNIRQAKIIDSNGETWLLRLGDYQTNPIDTRPTSLRLSKGKLFLKLAISRWQIHK